MSSHKSTFAKSKTIALGDDDEVLLSPTGVATVLGVYSTTLAKMNPQPPYFLLGKRKYVSCGALREWLTSKQQAALAA
jgi:hypothetical protein